MLFWQKERPSSYWKELNEDGRVAPVVVYPTGHKNYSVSLIREALTEARNETCRPMQGIAPIKNILGVGMLGDSKEIYRLDRKRIEDSLAACLKLGLPVADQFRITLLNLNGQGQGDFLHCRENADLIVIGYIFNRPTYTHPECRQSHDHYLRGAWHNAAAATGARVVTTYNMGLEVGPDDFAPAIGEESLFETKSVSTGNEAWDDHREVLIRKGVFHELTLA